MESDNDEDFKYCMTSIKPEADKVYVRGSKNNNEFTIINKSEKVKFVENMNAAKKQSLKVSLNNKSAFGNLVTEKKSVFGFIQMMQRTTRKLILPINDINKICMRGRTV